MSPLAAPRFAIATPSYQGDIQRCKLLCASIDHFVGELSTHYLLVEDADLALFKALEGPRRRVVPESELFPRWLRARPDPFSAGTRRLWTGLGALARGVRPLRGWHTQQLRKLALPRLADEEVMLYCDSDSIFLKPFALSEQIVDGLPRLYCKPGAISIDMPDHVAWTLAASRTLGLPTPQFPADDYINNMPTWRRDVGLALLDHVEARSGAHWIAAIARDRRFSEMLLYGAFARQVLGEAAGHSPTSRELTRTYWSKEDVGQSGLLRDGGMTEPSHVSIGVQSFIGVPMEDLWAVFRHAAGQR